MLKTSTSGFFRLLGGIYFFLAFLSVYFTTDLYWWPEQGVEKDWAPFPTGLMLLTPLFIIWGIICIQCYRLERTNVPFHERSKNGSMKNFTILFLIFFLLLLISVSSSHILSTMRFQDEAIQNPTYRGFLEFNFLFISLSSFTFFFLVSFSRLKIDNKNLSVLVKIGLLSFPLFQVLFTFFSVSFARNQYQFLGFGNGTIDFLSILSSIVLPIVLGVTGFSLAFTDLFPIFSPFLFVCTCLLLFGLVINKLYP